MNKPVFVDDDGDHHNNNKQKKTTIIIINTCSNNPSKSVCHAFKEAHYVNV